MFGFDDLPRGIDLLQWPDNQPIGMKMPVTWFLGAVYGGVIILGGILEVPFLGGVEVPGYLPSGTRSEVGDPDLTKHPMERSGDGFRILGSPVELAGGGWRISWDSEPGTPYILQRWNGDELGVRRDPAWIDVARVTAVGETASADDLTAAGVGGRYYRVVVDFGGPQGGEEFRILGDPVFEEEGWRVTWRSVAGRRYVLQRRTGDSLSRTEVPGWIDVASVLAEGDTSSAIDTPADDVDQRFYRVALAGDTPSDTTAPVVSTISATESTVEGESKLELQVSATDDGVVAEVRFFDGSVDLGVARREGDFFRLAVARDPDPGTASYFVARARDAAGNEEFSPVLRYEKKAAVVMVKLDENGDPTGEAVEVVPGAALPAFEFRPSGTGAAGAERELAVRFGEGSRVVVEEGREFIEFEEAEIRFGEESPLQFLPAGAGDFRIAGASSTAVLRIQTEGTRRLPLDRLSAPDLAEAFGYDPAEGIPVILFDRFPMMWRGGILEDGAIVGPLFSWGDESLPLPSVSGEYEGYRLDFLKDRSVRLPFYGEFTIPDGTGVPARISVWPARPLWLELRADGTIALGGSVEVQFANGASFAAELTLDDPVYRLALAARDLQVPAIVRLGELLPAEVDACIPGGDSDAGLDQAAACLETLEGALFELNRTAVESLPSAVLDNLAVPSLPAQFGAAGGSLLAGWASAAASQVTSALPLDDLGQLIEADLAAAEFGGVGKLAHHALDLAALREALGSGGLEGSAAARDQLEAALQQTLHEVRKRLGTSDAIPGAEEILTTATTMAALFESGVAAEVDPELGEGAPEFADWLAAAWAAGPGILADSENPNVTDFDRAAIFAALAAAAQLGENLLRFDGVAAVPDSLRQAATVLVENHVPAVLAALDDAESSGDVTGFLIALEELALVVDLRDSPLLQGSAVVAQMPDEPALADFVQRLESLADALLPTVVDGRSLAWRIAFMERLDALIERLPEGVGLEAEAFEILFSSVEAEVEVSLPSIESLASLEDVRSLILAGERTATLRRKLGEPSGDWASTQLSVLVTQFSQAAVAEGAFDVVHDLARLLLDHAARLEGAGAATAQRAYLEQAASLLHASRQIAAETIDRIQDHNQLFPGFGSLDFRLPGGLSVRQARGSARYDRARRSFEATFAGEVEVPEFGARLAIVRGALSSGGAMELDAFGDLQFPPANPIGRASIPESDPLNIRYDSTKGLQIAGAADFQFDNGMYFRGSIGLRDPVYEFALQAGGLKFDLLEAISFDVPALTPDQSISEADIALYNSLLESLRGGGAGTDEGMLQAAGQALGASTPIAGQPLFTGAKAADPLAALDAWGAYLAVENRLGRQIDPARTFDAVNRLLDAARAGMDDAIAEFEREQTEAFVPANSMATAKIAGERRAIQFDFGDAQTYSGIGPAYEVGLLSETETAWNVVTGNQTGGLVWADGSPADGVGIRFGRFLKNDGSADWSFVPPTSRFFQLLEEFPIGVEPEEYPGYALFRDGLISQRAGVTREYSGLLVRVSGLAPGFFVVLPIAHNSVQYPGNHKISVGRFTEDGGPSAFPVPEIFGSEEFFPVFSARIHYTIGGAALEEESDEYVVLSEPGMGGGYFGRLQGLQLVETPPRILSFTADPMELDAGGTSTLRWKTEFATSVRIEPGVGAVALQGSQAVSPQHTTTYTLTARNPSGVVRAQVVVQVNGADRQIAKIAEELERMNATYRRVAEHLDQVAKDQLLAKDTFIDRNRIQRDLDANAEILRRLLSEDFREAHRDKGTTERLTKAALDLMAAYASTGVEERFGQDETVQFYDRAANLFYQDAGLNPDTGEVDGSKVGSHSATESLQVIKRGFEIASTQGLIGSGEEVRTGLILEHLDNAEKKLLASIGFNPNTGSVELAGKSESELVELLDTLNDIDSSRLVLEEESTIPDETWAEMGTRLQDEALARLRSLSSSAWKLRFRSLINLVRGNHLRAKGGLTERYAEEVRWETINLAKQINAQAAMQGRVSGRELEALEFLEPATGEPEVGANYRERLEKALRGADALLSREWTQEDLDEGIPLLEELVGLHRRIRRLPGQGMELATGEELLPKNLLPRLGERFQSAGRAAKANQKLLEFSKATLAVQSELKISILPATASVRNLALASPESDPVVLALREVALVSTAAAADLAREDFESVEAAGAGARPIDLVLPGDLTVDRIFGRIYYNRETGFVEGGFGGRLEFPGINAFVELHDATLANDGSFSFSASTSGPLAFGEVRATAELSGSGGVGRDIRVEGSGQLLIPGDNGEQTFAASVSYDSAARRLQFDTDTADTTLRFSDDFVIFDAGLGFQVSGLNPGGELVLSGTGGLFAKTTPLPENVTADDFELVVLDTAISSAIDQNGFDLALDRGTLLLPGFFEPRNCDDIGLATFPPMPMAGGSGLAVRAGSGPWFRAAAEGSDRAMVRLSPDVPLLVSYRSDPDQVNFGGSLVFENIGLTVPGIEGFEVAICETRLNFSGDRLPELEDVRGVVQLALPQDVAILTVTDARWSLDGLPVGKVQLENNVTLFEESGFSLELLGANQEGCAAAGFRLEGTSLEDATFFLEGGVRLRAPLGALTDDFGDAVEFGGCGSLLLAPDALPVLAVDSASVEGNFHLGGEDGLRVIDARLTALNVDRLLNPDGAGEPFRVVIESGRLELANGAFFQINQGEFALDGTFLIDAEAGSGSGLDFAGVNVSASVTASGGPEIPLTFEGAGELEIVESGRRFAVALAYDQAAGRLAFASESENLDLRFTDDFVLFDAGFGFEVSASAQAGTMMVSGAAGLVAKAPLGESVDRNQFQLVVDEVQATLVFGAEGFSATLDQGMLNLPEIFATGLCQENPSPGVEGGPQILLNPERPIFVEYLASENRVSFGGEVEFRDLGFQVPGIDGLSVSVCRAVLAFNDGSFPILSQVNATLQIPLPDEPAVLDVQDASWSLDGFPVGTLALRDDVEIFNAGGFALHAIGQSNELCPEGTALTVESNDGAPFFRIDGGLRFSVPADVLTDDHGGELFAQVCAGIHFGFNTFPQLEVDSLAIGSGGDLRLGGPDGLVIKQASLVAEDIQNLFNQSPDSPFVLRLSGGFQIPDGPGFALQNAKFTFIGEDLPLFSIGGASLDTGSTFEVAAGLPLEVSEAGFTFKEQDLPLQQLVRPENMVITLGASLGLPPDEPVVSGEVEGLTVTLEDGVPVVQVSGIGLGIQDFEIPPLSLTGRVFIGGLGPGEDIYFAGNVGGSFQGAGIEALLAFNLHGPLGCCFSVNAGPAGIPLGQTGILFTGAEGGVSFLNTNGDPCDFQTFINVDAETGRPVDSASGASIAGIPYRPIGQMHVMTWEELRDMRERHRLYRQAAEARPIPAGGVQGETAGPSAAGMSVHTAGVVPASPAPAEENPEFPCPTGECPPATVNILCQPHPDAERYPDRVIVKFTSLDEDFLNEIGITREFIESSGLTTAEEIAGLVAETLRNAVEILTPRPDPDLTGPGGEPLGEELNALLDEVLAQVEESFRITLRTSIQAVLGNQDDVYSAILEAAYAGVRCPDATVKLAGTFSHLAVSSFLSGTGGAVVSSTGSAGLVGTVNLFGVPVGFLDGFVNATDANGDPNPSLCGEVRGAVGPLELGQLKALYECEGCMTGVLDAFVGLADCLSGEVVDAILPKVAPHLAGLDPATAFGVMTDAEKLAFLAEMFSLPPTPGTPECFFNLVVKSLESINPEFTMCGAVQPKLFGFPLTGSAVDVAAAADKTSMAGQFSFSSALLMGTYSAFFPIGDKASFGFGVAWPNPDDLIVGGLSGRFSDPAAFAAYLEESFAYMLENATYTIGFELAPFGLKGFQSGARVVMPNLTDHPEVSGWIAPEDRGQNLPSRLELMLAAVENEVLANPLWKGTADDIHLAFAEEDPRRQLVEGMSFARDYFPHGGIVGAARLGMPKALLDAPPAVLETLLGPDADLFARLGAALDYVQNYILAQSEVGTLGFYVPAPNPPIFTDLQGNALPPRDLLEEILSFSPELGFSSAVYPLDVAFLQGYMDGRLMGIPITRARVEATPPTESSEGRFLIASEIPEDSWMQSFVDNVSMTFEVRQPPQRSIEESFTGIVPQMQALLDDGAGAEAVAAFLGEFQQQLTVDLPKVSLDLAIDNLRIPQELEPVLALDGDTSARLVAYSPQYEPQFPGEGPMALARKHGGIAMQGRFRFADLVTVDNAELAIFAGQISARTGLPAMAGRFEVPLMPVGRDINLHNVVLDFNSEPAVGAAFLAASGQLDPIHIQPVMEIEPVHSGQSLLGGTLQVLRAESGSPATALSLEPAKIAMPIFAEGLSLQIHGADPGRPFTFSAEGPWSATVSLEGTLRLRDLQGIPVLELGSPDQAFTAALSGDGVEAATLVLQVPTGMEITAWPDSPFEQFLSIGAREGASARLVISSDGTFELLGGLESALTISGLPISRLNAGAEVRLTESSLTITGSVSGGSLDGVNTGSAQATVMITPAGISVNGMASIPPLQFGVFRISGLDEGPLQGVLDNESLRIPSGAFLAIQGVAEDVLTLEEFVVAANGEFTAAVRSGSVVVPGYFALTEGSARIENSGGVASFAMTSPRLTVFPGADFETSVPTALERVEIASNGRFYYDSGTQNVGLPLAFSASGRLEFGYEPDANAPLLAVDSSPVHFGRVDTGRATARTIRAENAGAAQLQIAAQVSNPEAWSVVPTYVSLAPGEAVDFQVTFTPNRGGTLDSTLELTHNTVTSPTRISLTGEGREVPVYYQSTDTVEFGEIPAGSGALRQVFLANVGQAPLEISSLDIDGPFSVSPAGGLLAPGESLRVFLTFEPEAVDAFESELAILANDDIASHRITVRGVGSELRWWTQRDSGPTLHSIDAGYAVGEEGTLLKMDWDGDRWTPQSALGNIQLNRVYSNPNGFGGTFAVGRSGVVLERNFSQWRPIADPVVAFGGNQYLGVATYWPSHFLMLVGERGLMVREHDFNVFSRPDSGTLEDLHDVAFSHNAAFGIVVGGDGTILRSTNQGGNWNPVAIPAGVDGINRTLRAVDVDADGVGLIVGDFGTVFRSAASGLNWQNVPDIPTDRALHDVRLVGDTAYAVGDDGVFLLSRDGGQSWQMEGSTAANRDLFGVMVNQGKVWAAGQGGFIQHRPLESPAGPHLVFSTGLLDFGNVPIGGTRRKSVTIHNRGTDSLVIDGISGGDLFSVNQTAMTIEPGGRRRLDVYFHPAAVTDTEPGQPTRVIAMDTNDPDGRHFLGVRGVASEAAWFQVGSATTASLTEVQFVDATTGFAIFPGGMIKTTDGGMSWAEVSALNPPGTVRALHFLNSQDGWVAGGDAEAPFILRTTNGGASWSAAALSPEIEGAVIDVSAAPGEDSRGYAVTAGFTTGQLTRQGMVLRTLNGGAGWTPTPVSRPAATFSGTAAHSYNPFRLYVASGGALYRSQNSGAAWEEIFNAGGAFPIRSIHTVGLSHGFVGGLNGIFRRTDDADNATPVWTAPAIFTAATILDIHFVTPDRGWSVVGGAGSGGTSGIFRTEDGGVTWREEFTIANGSINSVWGVGSAGQLAYAVGTGGRVWKYEPFTTATPAIAAVPALVDLGETESDQPVEGTIEVRNVGRSDLIIDGVFLNTAAGFEAFSLGEFSPTPLAPGAVAELPVTFVASQPGTYNASVTLTGNGNPSASNVELKATVLAVPQMAVLETDPPGLAISVDGQRFTAPVAFTIVEGADAAREWEPGSVHTIIAAKEQARDGVLYRFQTWEPAVDREFVFVASETATPNHIARYVRALDGEAASASRQVVASASLQAAAAGPPSGVPAGPWLRLSEASLTVPAVGNFNVQGGVFLSAGQFSATLDATAVRLPVSSADPELLKVTAGSWRLDYRNLGGNGILALRAVTPGVELFNVAAAPPAQLVFQFEGVDRFEASFATLGATPVLPGVMELGPGSVRLVRDPFLSVEADGELRLLKRPDGGWAMRRPFLFTAEEGPFVHAIDNLPDPLLDLGFLGIRTDASSQIEINRDASGAFGVAVQNLDLVLFDRSLANLSGAAASDGQINLTAPPPSTPFAIGPLQFETENNSTIQWNLRTGAFHVQIPAGNLLATGVTGWPANGIAFPGVSVDSQGDFEKMINLPDFTFNGIPIAAGGENAQNYLLWKRADGAVRFKVRDQREFFGNPFQLALDLDSTGKVGGSFSGAFEINTGFFGRLDFGSINLTYQPTLDPYQFQGRFPLIENDFGVYFGSGGGKFSHLDCSGPALEDCQEGLFSLSFP